MEYKLIMIYRSVFLTVVLFSSICLNKLHSETIQAIHKKIYPVAKGFLFMGGGWTAAFGETQEEGCTLGSAYGFPIAWDKPYMEQEYSCYSTTSIGMKIESTSCIFCSDGNYRKDQCDYPVTCPDDSWTLMADPDNSKAICYRSDDYCWRDIDHVSEEQLLAAIVYGEASIDNDMNEMYAIASATMNMVRAHTKYSLYFKKYENMFEFFQSKIYHDYSKALKNGNTRFRLIMCSGKMDERFDMAYQAARNALYNGHDYSNGACWWDGYDLKTEGSLHYRYKSPRGFRFSSPEHNLFSVNDHHHTSKNIKGIAMIMYLNQPQPMENRYSGNIQINL
jgi:hypothetical protein